MADNTFQEEANGNATLMLRHHFRGREDVLVANNLLVYYVKGDAGTRVVPDVMVALGVRGGHRMSYLVWEEGKAPDFVLEVASPGTVKVDLKDKPPLYARLGVREYFRYDPMGNLLPERLYGGRLEGAGFKPLPAQRLPDAEISIRSAVLGLELRYDGIAQRLRMWDPVAGEYLRTPEESEAARAESDRQRAEEARARREAERRTAEEARARREAERRWREAERQLQALRLSQ